MATLLSDSVTRANSTTLPGSPDVGPAPVVQSGTVGVNTNKLYAPSGTAIVTWDLGTPAVDFSFVRSASTTGGIVLGYVSANDFWYCFFTDNASTSTLFKVQNGTFIQMHTGAGLSLATSTLRASYFDQVISMYCDGKRVLSYRLDVPITATAHGMRFTSSNARADDLLATDSAVDPKYATVQGGHVYRGRDTKTLDNAGGA